jgi:tetratricopeptide (TPR) repeat protein
MIEVLEAYADYKMGRFIPAFEKWQALAAKGNVQGMLNTANMLMRGQGVDPDPRAALDWYRRGAAAGDAQSALEAARLIARHPALTQTDMSHRDALKRAATLGSAPAALELGCALVSEGAATEARKWLDQAANANKAKATACLADLPKTESEQSKASLSPRQEMRVTGMLSSLEAAANSRDIDWIMAHLSEDPVIRVDLVGQGPWLDLTPDALQQFWQATFRRADRYRFVRSDAKIVPSENGARVESRIVEIFASETKSRSLMLREFLHVRLAPNQRPLITRMTLQAADKAAKDRLGSSFRKP